MELLDIFSLTKGRENRESYKFFSDSTICFFFHHNNKNFGAYTQL
ncbi:hypothetical protein HMPREF9999_02352 [Alloprevotella sp. oral taxon 473 str. F0040]|nr:hypothetical protein HMPREF9999_02352 [Alloprevotella sp. oral taxon 473 str. F0040]